MEDNLLLFSGGLDSTLCLELLSKQYSVQTISFDYNQPHKVELKYAERFLKNKNIPNLFLKINEIPKIDKIVFSGRNAILLSIAFSYAYSKDIRFVTIGVNKDDSELFSDCRESFIDGMKEVAQAYNISLLTPLIGLTKKEIVGLGDTYALDTTNTWTCYFPTKENTPCGKCYSCIGRKNASH